MIEESEGLKELNPGDIATVKVAFDPKLKTAKEYVMEIVNLINRKEFINEYFY